ncbi:MAG: hypothetical protein D6820_03020 [Lentisphaerae bacterium]|nr:MAG: hypothetical protein D6820_03020 [Lentisphaerota bacterium]
MLRRSRQITAIAGHAVEVMTGDPLFLVLLLCCGLGMLFFASLPTFVSGEELRLIRDQAMAWCWGGGCIMILFAAELLIAGELRRGNLALIMSEGVSPVSVIAGKWLGLAILTLIFDFCLMIFLLWSTRLGRFGGEAQLIEWWVVGCYLTGMLLPLVGAALYNYFWSGNFSRAASLLMPIVLLLFFIISCLKGSIRFSEFGGGVDWTSVWGILSLLAGHLAFIAFVMVFAFLFSKGGLWAAGIVVFALGLFLKFILTSVLPDGYLQSLLLAVLPEWQIYWISDLLAEHSGGGWKNFLSLACFQMIQAAGLAVLYGSLCRIILQRIEVAGQYEQTR